MILHLQTNACNEFIKYQSTESSCTLVRNKVGLRKDLIIFFSKYKIILRTGNLNSFLVLPKCCLNIDLRLVVANPNTNLQKIRKISILN